MFMFLLEVSGVRLVSIRTFIDINTSLKVCKLYYLSLFYFHCVDIGMMMFIF